jgi:hypothetical protein
LFHKTCLPWRGHKAMIDGLNGYLHHAPADNRGLYYRPILGSLSITRRPIECTNHTGAIDQASRSWNPDRHPRIAKGHLDLANVLRKPDFLGCHFISCLLPGCNAPKCAQCSSGGRFRIYSCPRDKSLRTGPSDPATTPTPRRSRGDVPLPAVALAAPAEKPPSRLLLTCKAIVQPRRVAYSRLARVCMGMVFRSCVDTRT